MNRTASSPDKPVFITEFGSPLEEQSCSSALATARHVVSVAASKPFLSMIIHWQVINNELDGGLCGGQPITSLKLQRGFWEVLPNGTRSCVGDYLRAIINSTEPIPPLS
mmetsp:Transcript_71269/g.168003  ORF Transcript_71269/g.168003 Transcript_71269/m.168003 type:complete len:109 (-) Transcript_71269:193-519(-)